MDKISRRGFVKGAALVPLAFTPLTLEAQSTAPGTQFDIVVAGAGHNSLVSAAYLAKAGYRCVVLEGRPIVGGDVKTAEMTLKGFLHDTCSSAHNGMQENPLIRDNELNLGDYGLEYIFPDPVFHMPFLDGAYITQWRDLDRTCDEFAKYSKKGRGYLSPHVQGIGEDRSTIEFLAAPPGHVALGNRSRELRGRSLPHLHARLSLVAAACAVSHDWPRGLFGVSAAAA